MVTLSREGRLKEQSETAATADGAREAEFEELRLRLERSEAQVQDLAAKLLEAVDEASAERVEREQTARKLAQIRGSAAWPLLTTIYRVLHAPRTRFRRWRESVSR